MALLEQLAIELRMPVVELRNRLISREPEGEQLSPNYLAVNPAGAVTGLAIPQYTANVANFGATGNGVSDDSGAIQQAINSLPEGGVVFLPPGTYRIAHSVVLNPFVILQGADESSVILKAANGLNNPVVLGLDFFTLTGKAYAAGDWQLGAPGSGCRDLTVDGNKANNASGQGIAIWGRATTLENVVVQSCASNGIWTEFTDVDNFADPNQKLEGWFQHIVSTGNALNGWQMRGPHDSVAIDYIAYENGNWALVVDSVAGGYDGGITVFAINSYLNTSGSVDVAGEAFVDLIGGTLSGNNIGTGLQLGANTGACRLVGTGVAGHTPGVVVAGTNHVLDIIATNNPGDVLYINGAGWCEFRVTGEGNANIVNIVAQNGPNVYSGAVTISGTDTLTISPWGSQDTVLFSANGTAGTFSVVKLPTTRAITSNNYSPIFPDSNGTMMANEGATNTATTGGAGALPALPSGYIVYTDPGGGSRRIPYYQP